MRDGEEFDAAEEIMPATISLAPTTLKDSSDEGRIMALTMEIEFF
jgi:hypothetical protein